MVSTRRSTASSSPVSPAGARKATPKKRRATKDEEESDKEEEEKEVAEVTNKATPRKKKIKSPAKNVDEVVSEESVSAVPSAIASPSDQEENKDVKKKTHEFEYEFGGPLGALCTTLCLPIVIYALFFLCNKDYCLTTSTMSEFDFEVFKKSLPNASEFLNDSAAYAILGWMFFHVLLERILPGEIAYGTELLTGNKLAYCLSGHLQFWVTVLVIFFGCIDYSYNTEGIHHTLFMIITI
jgi:ribosomal protein L12E/L44/L45/RPP1/RPP2